jgi:glc operon protein GlcG
MHQQLNLSHSDAMSIIDAIRTELDKDNRGAAIAVVDTHGELLAFLRTDGCKLPSVMIAINKAYTAARECVESFQVGQDSKKDGFPMTNFGDLRYTAWGGGVPIMVQGQIVGAVGVSGLPEADDMQMARMGAALIVEK